MKIALAKVDAIHLGQIKGNRWIYVTGFFYGSISKSHY